MDDLEEPVPRLVVFGIVQQRFGVALDGGERRAQLVRDVGHEVAANLVGALEVGDVVHHEHRAAPRRFHGRHAGHQRAGGVAREGQLQAVGLLAGQRAADVFHDARVADGLHVGMVERALLELEDAPGGVVHQLQASLLVDHEHAFHHAGEDGLHPGAVARQAVEAAAQLLHGLVHAAHHLAQVVVAVIGRRPAEIPQRVAPGGREHGGHPRLLARQVAGPRKRRHRQRERGAGQEREEDWHRHQAGAGSSSL